MTGHPLESWSTHKIIFHLSLMLFSKHIDIVWDTTNEQMFSIFK